MVEELRAVVAHYPVVDNHGHNLLKQQNFEAFDFLSITSEAQGDALADAVDSLSHLRVRRQLKRLYEFQGPDINWNAILAARREWLKHPEALYHKCFQGVETILIDDGLDAENVYPFDWHDQWLEGKTKRIVRIETVAEKIMREQIAPTVSQPEFQRSDAVNPDMFEDHFETFTDSFRKEISEALGDLHVAGFKSVICYRSGLAIDLNNSPIRGNILTPFSAWALSSSRIPKSKCRLDSKPLNDWLVMLTMSILSNPEHANNRKPIQFHTGLGDNDMNLHLSNPAHLQPLIAQYPQVPIVLLHSSYPYTREAGYLATVYKNVYLDLGLIFPMISKSGQDAILSQAMELTPTSKLLYSSDGHWFPETYYLALIQFRESLEKTLVQAVEDESLDVEEAIRAAQQILFQNSNLLYRLNLDNTITKSSDEDVVHDDRKEVTNSALNVLARRLSESSDNESLELFEEFEKRHPNLSFVYVQWFDYMGTMRARVLPIDQFRQIVMGVSKLGISTGNIGTLQNDFITKVVNTTGVMYVVPDLKSIRPTHRLDPLNHPRADGYTRTSATVLASWHDESGMGLSACPRSRLESILEELELVFDIEILMGFEIELTLLYKPGAETKDTPLTATHAWSTLSTEQWNKLDILREIYDALGETGIHVQQFHAESGPGQYEIILPPEKALRAIDTLLQARQVIRQIASKHGLRATLHPSLANGAHTHISLSKTEGKLDLITETSHLASHNFKNRPVDSKDEWSFFAGVMHHLRGICAFTLPQAESYDRVADDHWAGGRWIAWGTQNRETPLRRVKPGYWEFRALDGMPNVYLAHAAILLAGVIGLEEHMEMKLPDCKANPSRLRNEERSHLGITENLPLSIDESLEALSKDEELWRRMGEDICYNYVIMKEAEQKMLQEKSAEERWDWLMERY